ncbi:PREDICTED: probable protein phosphatase 2C 69 isoform X2 [Tarenaya hassleriana]|nr:PREDICTED: probable protein phosphatase 2C 69 isoform X2 [Tarenaya hassleriana]XP_010519629.1 PREDICTED: probable protein phosphatase 2C 69 isoform X2 [Tarenaya hassleriana]
MRIADTPASGGGLSQNGKFSYGYASSAGKRSSMEDFYETRIDGVDGKIVGLFGVFDGHGGARAAEYVKQNLFSNLISHPKFISDTKSAIADAYNHTDSELLKSENTQSRDAGSTASTAILVGDRLLVANVGDSRAVICRGGNAIAVSRDHKPDQTDERERIENAGGFVMWAGTWRVGGVLAVSRAFGDRLLKQYVVADPEIKEEKIDSSLEFLILASDGLWDVVSNEEAVSMVKQIEDSEEAAKKLVTEAIQRGSADNITCVVVRFLESKTANNPTYSASSSHNSSATEADQGKIAVLSNSNFSNSAKETKQGQIPVRSDSTRTISAKEGNSAIDSDSNHSNSAKETNQGQIAVSSDSNRTITAKEGNNQGQITIHSDSDRVISAKEGNNQGKIAVLSDSNRSNSAKETKQGQIANHSDSDRVISAKEGNNHGNIAVLSDSNRSNSAKETKQGQIAVSSDSNRTITAKEGNKNKGQIAIHSDSDGRISGKDANSGQNAVQNVSNRSNVAKGGRNLVFGESTSATNPKLVEAATNAANQKAITDHSDSERRNTTISTN